MQFDTFQSIGPQREATPRSANHCSTSSRRQPGRTYTGPLVACFGDPRASTTWRAPTVDSAHGAMVVKCGDMWRIPRWKRYHRSTAKRRRRGTSALWSMKPGNRLRAHNKEPDQMKAMFHDAFLAEVRSGASGAVGLAARAGVPVRTQVRRGQDTPLPTGC